MTLRDQSTTGILNNLWARLSLQTKTLSIFLLVALVPVIGLAIYSTAQTQQALTAAAETSLRGNAAQSAASLDAFIKTTLDAIRVEAQSPDLIEYMALSPSSRAKSPAETRTLAYLNVLDQKDSINILSYAVIDRNGLDILDIVRDNIGTSEADALYFQKVLETGVPYASPAVYRKDGDNFARVIYFASPIRNAKREIIGVLRVIYDASVLQQLAISSSQSTGSRSSVIVLDEFHIRQADTTNSTLNQTSIVPLSQDVFDAAVSEGRLLQNISLTEQATDNIDFESALSKNAESQLFEADLFPDITGSDTVATARMKNKPWIVVVSQPRSLLLENVQRQTFENFLILVVVAIVVGGIAVVTSRTLTGPLISLTQTAESIASGNFGSRALVQTQDEIGVLASSFNQMADQLNQTLSGLEQRVEERTQALTNRSKQLEAIAGVAHSLTSVQEMDRLLAEIAILVSERFGFYHVGIFLLDVKKEYANLRSANSQGGKKMLARGHRLKVGEQGIVGFVTARGQARIALDVGSEAVYFNNPDLPDTHSEVALPLKIGSEVIGALDIQSTQTNAFSTEEVEIFSILADQVSVAIQNARSLEQAQRALYEAKIASGRLTGQAWQGYAEKTTIKGYRYDGIKPEAIRTPKPPDDKDALSVPVQLRGQVIGRLKLKASHANHKWTEDELAVIASTTERVAIALESARLLDEAQRRATRESFLSEMGAKLGTSFQLDSILRDTVEELGKQLKGSTVYFQLVNPSAPPTAENKGSNTDSSHTSRSDG